MRKHQEKVHEVGNTLEVLTHSCCTKVVKHSVKPLGRLFGMAKIGGSSVVASLGNREVGGWSVVAISKGQKKFLERGALSVISQNRIKYAADSQHPTKARVPNQIQSDNSSADQIISCWCQQRYWSGTIWIQAVCQYAHLSV